MPVQPEAVGVPNNSDLCSRHKRFQPRHPSAITKRDCDATLMPKILGCKKWNIGKMNTYCTGGIEEAYHNCTSHHGYAGGEKKKVCVGEQ